MRFQSIILKMVLNGPWKMLDELISFLGKIFEILLMINNFLFENFERRYKGDALVA